MYKSTNNTVSGSTVTENLEVGINLGSRSSNNTVCSNYLSNNKYGLSFFNSANNTVAENIFTNNEKAIHIASMSSNNVFRSNSMVDNEQSFLVDSNHVTHDVDSSNTVNGKPMYYWVNRRDMEVPSDAGYVFLVNCTGITVRNLNLDTGQKIILHSTTNSRIIQNVLRNSYIGLEIRSSDNNTVAENNITNNNMGIWLYGQANNIIGNHIANNGEGIYFGGPVYFRKCVKNTIYHNNFIDNTKQVNDVHWEIPYSVASRNRWDNGAEGNYWSNYEERCPNATEIDDTGIWDTPYVIDEDNKDRYPLTSPTQPDTTPPTITITNPQNETIPVNHTSLNFTVNEFTTWMGYTLDGATNITVAGNTTLTALSDETHRLTLYAEDDAGNMGASEPVYFTVDITPPTITVLAPKNQTYSTPQVDLNFTTSEPPSWTGYSLDKGENVTVTGTPLYQS